MSVRWFDALPIHRKLVTLALAVTTAALALAILGLLVADLWQHRRSVVADTGTLTQVVAQNSVGAVRFTDPEHASESLESMGVLPAVRRACLYLTDGTFFAGFSRTRDMECPAAPPTTQRFTVILSSAAVVGEQGQIGTLVVERDLDLIQDRAAVTVSIAAGMLLFAGALAALLANRLTRRVSDPIAHLAVAARSIGHAGEDRQALGNIAAPPDEVGELVTAFRGMVGRLLQSNDALRHEIDQRGKMEAEREELLVRERETSRLKDEFLAAVSHELRTPLNAILGWVQMLGSTGLNPEMTAKAVASIGRNAQAQTRVIEDLVDVSRIVTGKLHLRLELVELRTATAGAIDVIRPVAAAKRVSIETEFTSEASLVMADEVRVRQILWNLLSNAVKFTPAGGTVTVALQSDDGMHEIAVSDSGVGIRQEFLPYVFDRFRQADGSMTREYGGLGLGLSIVKDLTEAHGGSVAVSSRGEGLGATFRVRLPRAGEGTAETQPQRPS